MLKEVKSLHLRRAFLSLLKDKNSFKIQVILQIQVIRCGDGNEIFLWCMPRLTRALKLEKMSWLKYFHVLHSFHGKTTSSWKKLIPWRTCRNKQSSNSFGAHINDILFMKYVLKRTKVHFEPKYCYIIDNSLS